MSWDDENGTAGKGFIKVMETFPCLFNIGTMKKPNHSRLTFMMKSLENDIQKKEEDYEGLRIKELNLLTWIYFQLGDLEEAKSKNDDSLCINTDELVTLGNRAFLEWYSGSDLSTFLTHLENLKLKEDFPERRRNAIGAQAHFLFRLGGIYNMASSIQMVHDLLSESPDNFEWKYYLCLAQRRLRVMTWKNQDEKKIQQMFKYISENATHDYWRSASMCELAIMLATNNAPVRVVESLIERALQQHGDEPVVLRKCGMALTRQGNPKGIELLEQSIALKSNTVTHHSLAKSLVDYRLVKNRGRQECDRKAAFHFRAAFESSMKENKRPLIDLTFLYLLRNRYDEALKVYKELIHDWTIRENLQNPFILAKVMIGWYQCLRCTRERRNEPLFYRYLSIALSTAVELYKLFNASPIDRSLIFDLFVNPTKNPRGDKSLQSMADLMRDCVRGDCARQKAMRLQFQGRLEDAQSVTEEIEHLLEKDQPGEALLMLDIFELQRNRRLVFSPNLKDQAMLEEAKWQLGEGLMSCKLLFHKLFNMRHSKLSAGLEGDIDEEDDSDESSPEADVLILQDGHHWRPFLQDSTDQEQSSDESSQSLCMVNQNRMCEDIITSVFDLETITNPWLHFSGTNRPNIEEFSGLLKQFRIRTALLVVDVDTSFGFLQMADYLLSAIRKEDDADVAIVYTQGDAEATARARMPTLMGGAGGADAVRCFKADAEGFARPNDSKPVTDLVGTEILDAFFSGDAQNAVNFFHFLAPKKY